MRTIKLALIAAAISATALPPPAVAHADRSYYAFLSPSKNVRCVLSADDGPAPIAQCQIDHYTYVPPPAAPCADGGAKPGWEFRLDQGKYPYLPCEYSALDSGEGNQLAVLDYGQTRTLGSITCDSEPAGMTCTDSSTGHFFRVSQQAFQLG
jgi:hypothetical protein